MVETSPFEIQNMTSVIREKHPFMSNIQLYKELYDAGKQFANDFKYGVL